MKLVAAVALATLIASPALAQSYDPDIGSGNIVPPPGAQWAPSVASGRNHFAAHRHTRGKVASRPAQRLYLSSGRNSRMRLPPRATYGESYAWP